MKKQIIQHITDNDLYSFTVCYLYLKQFPRSCGQYTFIDRNNTVYPKGFAELVKEQLKLMEQVVITDEELTFIANKCYYLPNWFCTFLKGFRFSADEVTVSQDDSGHLHITIEGLLWKTIFWEVPLLAIISELYFSVISKDKQYNETLEYEKSLQKGIHLIQSGLLFSDFGTRRRFSFAHHEKVVESLIEANKVCSHEKGMFIGTSNVYLAMKQGTTPIGTMSHQVISFCGAIFGYKEANYLAMDYWQDTFDSDLGTFLFDTFGWSAFEKSFSRKHAKLFDGLRIDSGDNLEAIDYICAKYKELGVDPLTKTLTFSNSLSVDKAIDIHRYCKNKIQDSYGIGTFLTCDITGATPLNIVVKLSAAKLTEKKEWQKAIKLSCDPGKYSGDPEEVELAKRTLGIP